MNSFKGPTAGCSKGFIDGFVRSQYAEEANPDGELREGLMLSLESAGVNSRFHVADVVPRLDGLKVLIGTWAELHFSMRPSLSLFEFRVSATTSRRISCLSDACGEWSAYSRPPGSQPLTRPF